MHFSTGSVPSSGFAWRFRTETREEPTAPRRAARARAGATPPSTNCTSTRGEPCVRRVADLRSRGCCILGCVLDETLFWLC